MRAMRAEGFSGYKDLKLADIPKPQVSDGRVLVKIAAAGVTPLEHTFCREGTCARNWAKPSISSESATQALAVVGQRSPNCAALAHRQPGCDQPDFAVHKFVS